MAFNTLNQRAAFDHLLKARILYDPNSRYVLDAQTNALNSGSTNVTINNLLPQRLQQIDTQLASHKTLPTVTWDNIPGPLPPPNQTNEIWRLIMIRITCATHVLMEDCF